VNCVEVPEGLHRSSGRHQDVLGSRMIWNEVCDVINTLPERKSFNRFPNGEKREEPF
jgi:hypothetical protein